MTGALQEHHTKLVKCKDSFVILCRTFYDPKFLKEIPFFRQRFQSYFFQEPATTVTLFSIKIEQRRLTNLLHEAQTPTHTHQLLLLPPTCLAIFQFSSSAFVACISCVMLELFLSNVLAFLSSNSCSCLQLL